MSDVTPAASVDAVSSAEGAVSAALETVTGDLGNAHIFLTGGTGFVGRGRRSGRSRARTKGARWPG